MVTATPGLQTDLGLDELDADSEVIDDSPESEVEAEPSKEAPDPLAELRAKLDGAARRDELESLRNQVRSELGRSQRLEARLEAMAGVNPLADVDPRLDANERLLTTLADALIASIDDASTVAGLRSALAGLDQAKGVRATNLMRAELKDEILSALPKPAVESDARTDDPWVQATADVVADLKELLPDFDPTTIPIEVWNAGKAKGTPARAAAHVIRWAEQKAQEPVADRVTARRQAAGQGAPSRTGAPANDEDVIARYADGDRTVTDEQYRAANHRLGLD